MAGEVVSGAVGAPVATATVESEPVVVDEEVEVPSSADLVGDPPEHAASSTAAPTPSAPRLDVIRHIDPTVERTTT